MSTAHTIKHDVNNDYGTVISPGTVQFKRVLPGPIERVWEYLVDSEKRGKWFASGKLEPRVGGKIDLFFKHSNLSSVDEPTPEQHLDKDQGVKHQATVTRWEPPRVLAYSADLGNFESEITFELAPQGEKVLMTLTHRKLPNRDMMVGVGGGWHTHIGILINLLEGREQGPFWSRHAVLHAEYEKRIPQDA